MALAISEDHRSLADVATAFASGEGLSKAARLCFGGDATVAERTWKQICQMGWPGLHLPEEFGGSGYGLPELAVVLEALGASAAPGPLLPAAIGSAILNAVADQDLRRQLLPDAAAGTSVVVYAYSQGLAVDSGSLVHGDSGPVLGGAWATHVIAQHGEDLLVIDVLQDQVARGSTSTLDPAAGICSFQFSGANARKVEGGASAAIAIARTLVAAEASGGAGETLRMALGYSKIRVQFGRTIGSFQAIKHKLADMLADSERATAVAWDAVRASGLNGDQSRQTAAVAAVVGIDAYQRNAQVNIQIHGGIGFTWEHDAHLFLRRAMCLSALFGRNGEICDEIVDLAERGVARSYAVDLPPEAEEYRARARGFLDAIRSTPQHNQRVVLADSGYLVPHWPRPWGLGAGAVEQLVIDEELAGLDIPNLGIGGWVTLTLTQHGTPNQLERWIRASLLGELVWCQLFSEPNAGSDAAAVQSKGVRVPGGWRVTGQKVWTSGAQTCNRGLATIRTDSAAPKHRGITTMVIDLDAVGVEIRPLREITGEALFNEVFLDDVFVPDSDIVGDVNGGWVVARATLGNERVSIGGKTQNVTPINDFVSLLAQCAPHDKGLRREIGRLMAEDQAVQLINLRHVARSVEGHEPGAEGNITKMLASELAQKTTELALRIVGVDAAGATPPQAVYDHLMSRCFTIAGGTSEISRNVIAERLLGLPREDRRDQ